MSVALISEIILFKIFLVSLFFSPWDDCFCSLLVNLEVLSKLSYSSNIFLALSSTEFGIPAKDATWIPYEPLATPFSTVYRKITMPVFAQQ